MPYKDFLDTLSAPRCGVYKRVFRTQTIEELSGAVLWGQEVSMVLQSLMVTFEVVLRNRIHSSLSLQATKGSPVASQSFAWYDHLLNGTRKLEGETFAKVEAILCDAQGIRLNVQPSPDRVIARLSLGVWPNILDQQLSTQAIEAKTFKDVFPFHPRANKHWNHQDNRKDAVAVLKDVRAWRNRISHCKPVWSEGWYRNSVSQHWTEVLNRVTSRRAAMLEVLQWMCPKTYQVYSNSFSGKLFEALMTEDSVMDHITATVACPPYPAANATLLAAYKQRP